MDEVGHLPRTNASEEMACYSEYYSLLQFHIFSYAVMVVASPCQIIRCLIGVDQNEGLDERSPSNEALVLWGLGTRLGH